MRGVYYGDFIKRCGGGWNKYSTKAIKGICAVFVMLSHIFTQVSWAGFLAVGIFFAFSGYGLLYSWKTKENYLDSFFQKRIIKIFIPFVTAYMVSVGLHLFLDDRVSTSDFIKDIVCLKFLPASWYVIAIVVFYIAFYLIASSSKSEWTVLLAMIVFWIIYCMICIIAQLGTFWYNSSLGFVIGILGASVDAEKLRIDKKKIRCASWLFATMTVLLLVAFTSRHLVTDMLYSTALTSLIAIFVLSYEIECDLLDRLGDISYEIYLVHPIVIYCVKQLKIGFWITALIIIVLSIMIASFWSIARKKSKFSR